MGDASPTVSDLAPILDDTVRAAVAEALRVLAKACRARDYSTEGIPMVLVLEDVEAGTGPSSGDPVENALTALLGVWAMESLDLDEMKPYDIATAFEVLAYRLLEPPASLDG